MGGAETITYQLVSSTKDTYEHIVISLHSLGHFGPILSEIGIKVYALNMPRGSLTFKGLFKLFSLCLKFDPNIIQARLDHANLISSLVVFLCNKPPVIWAVHAVNIQSVQTWKNKVIRFCCAKLSYYSPRYIVSDSFSGTEFHASLGYCKNKLITIPNGIDLFKFQIDSNARSIIRKEFQIKDDVFVLGLLARWDSLKDHNNLLEALFFLKQWSINFVCLLAGGGVNENNIVLKKLIIKYDLINEIHLLDLRNDTCAIMNALDVHVVSSSSESGPIVVLEAMACGTQCVTTDVGDAARLVDKFGAVVPPRNSLAIAEELKKIAIKNRVNYSRQEIRHHIEENHSLRFMINDYSQVWESALN